VFKKSYLFIIIFIILSILIFVFKDYLKHELLMSFPPGIQKAIKVALHPELINNLENDYNVNFLPNTQFIDLNYYQVDLKYDVPTNLANNFSLENYQIDIYKDLVYSVTNTGHVKQFVLTSDQGIIKVAENKNISSNLNNINIGRLLDLLVNNEYLYISYIVESPTCDVLKISRAKLNINPLYFEKIYEPDRCIGVVPSTTMQFYKHNNKDGILLTSGNNFESIHLAQDPQSTMGKILFLDLSTYKASNFTTGHRNPQGLLVFNDIIISTEHGPRGGDEINKIEYNTNYGWPISSYGEPYEINHSFTAYDKNHELNNFKEPIFSFIPSIGISEIINLPNSFSKNWQNNFLMASLKNESLYRIRFDSKFSRVIYMERIFIGEMIRDIKYYSKLNIILLNEANRSGKIGILSVKKN
jgi:hypothetical protein